MFEIAYGYHIEKNLLGSKHSAMAIQSPNMSVETWNHQYFWK